MLASDSMSHNEPRRLWVYVSVATNLAIFETPHKDLIEPWHRCHGSSCFPPRAKLPINDFLFSIHQHGRSSFSFWQGIFFCLQSLPPTNFKKGHASKLENLYRRVKQKRGSSVTEQLLDQYAAIVWQTSEGRSCFRDKRFWAYMMKVHTGKCLTSFQKKKRFLTSNCLTWNMF